MTDVRLGRSNTQVVILFATRRENFTDSIRFNRVAHWCASAMTLNIRSFMRLTLRIAICCVCGSLLLWSVWQRNRLAFAVCIDGSTSYLRVNVATHTNGLIRPLQDNDRAAFTTRISIRRCIKRVTKTTGRQGTKCRERQRRMRSKNQVHSRHDSHVTVTPQNSRASQV